MVKDVENGFAGSCFESWRTDPGATTVAAAEQEQEELDVLIVPSTCSRSGF